MAHVNVGGAREGRGPAEFLVMPKYVKFWRVTMSGYKEGYSCDSCIPS